MAKTKLVYIGVPYVFHHAMDAPKTIAYQKEIRDQMKLYENDKLLHNCLQAKLFMSPLPTEKRYRKEIAQVLCHLKSEPKALANGKKNTKFLENTKVSENTKLVENTKVSENTKLVEHTKVSENTNPFAVENKNNIYIVKWVLAPCHANAIRRAGPTAKTWYAAVHQNKLLTLGGEFGAKNWPFQDTDARGYSSSKSMSEEEVKLFSEWALKLVLGDPEFDLWWVDIQLEKAQDFECSICLEHPKTSMTCLKCQCVVCEQCKPRIEKCPICKITSNCIVPFGVLDT